MICPVCNESMIVLELNKVEIDYCTNCSGIWLDKGELELLYSVDESGNALQNLFSDTSLIIEKSYKCPLCRKRMKKIQFNNSELVIDKCPDNHGLWFDKGELEKILYLKSTTASQKIIELLKEMFSYNKSQEAE